MATYAESGTPAPRRAWRLRPGWATVLGVLLFCASLSAPTFLRREAPWGTPARGAQPGAGETAAEMLLAANDLFLSKPPYTVLVPKSPRGSGEFWLLVDDRPPLGLRVDCCRPPGAEGGGAAKEVLLSIGSDFAMSCKYSLEKGEKVKIHEFAVTAGRSQFVDLNADGEWDMRIVIPGDLSEAKARTKVQVWYGGQWRDATQGDRAGAIFKKLLGGPEVLFDAGKGAWVPRAGAAQGGRQ